MAQMVQLKPASGLFKGRQFDPKAIVLCERWYLSFKLSSRDLVKTMSERSIALAHTKILRWVQRYPPELRSSGSATLVGSVARGVVTKPLSR